jgi:hypothetical protein
MHGAHDRSGGPALLLGSGLVWGRLRTRLRRSSATTPREGAGRWL